ncbi:MAG: tripartite tricarboxylate transporter substrate binding protein [Burkholderiales bacterium]
MKHREMQVCRAAALLFGLGIASAAVHAQTTGYPTRPIRLLVPFAPGGSSDAIGRILGQKMGEAMGQQLVIDNRAGAASVIGRDLAAKAPPDGYTLLLGDAVHTINVHVLKNVPYDPVNDFTFITLIGDSPMALAVHPTGAQNLKDFIAQAKAQPGKINYGMGGNGSITHLTGELFKGSAQVNLVAIPYKSIGLAVNDLLGAQVQAAFPSLPPTVAHVRAGRLRVLAVASSKRVPALAEAPTFAESGVQGMVVSNWFGLMGPAKLPAPVVAKLHAEAVKALQAPDVREKFSTMALELVGNQPAEFKAMIETELVRWAKVVKQAGIAQE